MVERSQASIFGAAKSFMKRNDKIIEFPTREAAQHHIDAVLSRIKTQNLTYEVIPHADYR